MNRIHTGAAIFGAVLPCLVALPIGAAITEIRITKQERFADGASFGETGPYVRIAGWAKGELDPRDARNRVIVNLERAPRNARGQVEYEVEFYLMRPADMAMGSGVLYYDVTNRGRKFLLPWLQDAVPTSPGGLNEPATLAHAGNALVFRRGYSVLWSGWDPDAPTAANGMTIRIPVATAGGAPIVQRIRDEIQIATRGPGDGSEAKLSYDAASLDRGRANLSVRAREADPAVVIPSDGWEYTDSRTIRLLPAGTKFKPGWIYDFHYPAKDPKVLGIGLAATRDLVSFLRYEKRDSKGTPNPLLDADGRIPIRHALTAGISQAGRYLRDHIAFGFNQDLRRRKVFDGALAHISGIGRVFINEPFAQPNRTNTQHEDHHMPENGFPFAHGVLVDPVSGRRGGLLRRDGFDPLVIEVNTSTEYWQKGASLLHTDPLGRRDVPVPPGVRLYMVAGTQHGGRAHLTTAAGPCANLRNPHSPAPALRALLVALEEWVRSGTPPPASRTPTIAGGTLVGTADTGFPRLPGLVVASTGNAVYPFGDWVDPKPQRDKAYGPKVARVDADGNETSGILLPDIAVPVATYTGWNLYKAPFPEGELCDRDGSYLPFALTRAEREKSGDPRPSMEERYGSGEAYAARVAEVARALVRERLLLPEDARAYVLRARSMSPPQ